MIQLNKNESYWLLDEALARAALPSGSEILSTYPDYSALKEDLAAYAGVTPDTLLLTPGSDAGIEHIVRTYAEGGKKCVLPVPTFYGYESILERVGADIDPVCYVEEEGCFVFPLEATIKALSGAAVLFLCNPNNPLGAVIPEDDLKHILKKAHEEGVLVVSDEAYFEFSGQTLLPLLKEYENLIIVRTFSKGFGLSGARVGYIIASPAHIKNMANQVLPWPVAHESVFAARALLARVDAVRERVQKVKAERAQFMQELANLPQVSVYSSEANFILVRIPSAASIQQALANADIHVALGEPMSRFAPAKGVLKETIRIAIPSPADRPKVIAVLRELLTV